MDTIVIVFKTAMGIPLVRILFIAWCVIFLFICMLSIATAQVTSRRLFKKGKDGAKKAPLDAIIENYKQHPEKWLLYEEEIFYVKDPEELTGEDLEAYERARVRCVDGGKDARQVGSRIRVRRSEAQAYLRFFYGLHKERKQTLKPFPHRKWGKKEEPEDEENVEETEAAEAAPIVWPPLARPEADEEDEEPETAEETDESEETEQVEETEEADELDEDE